MIDLYTSPTPNGYKASPQLLIGMQTTFPYLSRAR